MPFIRSKKLLISSVNENHSFNMLHIRRLEVSITIPITEYKITFCPDRSPNFMIFLIFRLTNY